MTLVPIGDCAGAKPNPVMRDSVIYPIVFPGQKRELNFKVGWVQGPDRYIGTINSDDIGRDVMQVRLYNMGIKSR